MKVAELQDYLANLGRCLQASGAKSVAKDLETISQAMVPFRDQSLKVFADFLIRAEAYSRGELPPSGKAGRGSNRPRSTGKESVDAEGVARMVRDLYDRVSDPAVTADQIEAGLQPLAKLSKDGLIAVAEAIDLKGMKSKPKNEIIVAINQRLAARKGATHRAGLIDRPNTTGSHSGQAQPSVLGQVGTAF
jgi:hypothetical protein